MTTLPLHIWAYIALSCLLGMLCRRWPIVALYGATGAFCEVYRNICLTLPSEPSTVFVDAVLFVLPTIPLSAACGLSNLRISLRFLTIPVAIGIHMFFGSETRALFLPIGVAFAQGTAALSSIPCGFKNSDAKMERWAATCIAAIGLLGIGFSPIWADIAWTGVAAHAFACLAYLANEER